MIFPIETGNIRASKIMNRVFHDNTFFSDDIGDLGIIDHTHNIHSDFFFEFWDYRKFGPDIERRISQNILNLRVIAQLISFSLCFGTQRSRFKS